MTNSNTVHTGIDGEAWREMARIYKQMTEGTSIKPISIMLERMNALFPWSKATGIYDSGSGPGGVISRIISDCGSIIPPSASLSCSDFSGAMVEQVRKTKAEETAKNPNSPWSRLEAEVRDAMNLEGVADESQSHVSAGWVYFMTPDPQKCLSESKRVLQPGGVLCCSSWKGSEWMDLFLVLKKLRPEASMPFVPDEWKSAPALQAEFEKAGFQDVSAEEVEVTMTFENYDAFIDVMLTKMPVMINLTKDFSDDERAKLRQLVLEEIRRVSPKEPGSMRGTALVAVGRT